jgi:enterochelin esterase family protein
MIAFLLLMATNSKVQLPVNSPGVQPDLSVRFEFRAPNAKRVGLNLEGSDEWVMEKGKDGIWSFTTQPLTPDLYGYSFNVDGVPSTDPTNSSFKPNLIWQSNMILVPGTPAEPWEVQDVPHGSLTEHFYRSDVAGDQRDYWVYTPPQYKPSGGDKFPVLYLLHGYSDTAIAWSAVGKANVILDNLIAAKKVKPLIVVMPLGYGVPGFGNPGGRAFSDKVIRKRNYDQFRTALLSEVIPMVETQYRISKDRKQRAIAGLSMGGYETLYVGLNNLDKFAYVGAFSAGGFPEKLDDEFPNLDGSKINRSIKSFWISCGVDDGLIQPNRGLVSWLNQKNVKVQLTETPGRHDWMVWRRDLIEFSQTLFK